MAIVALYKKVHQFARVRCAHVCKKPNQERLNMLNKNGLIRDPVTPALQLLASGHPHVRRLLPLFFVSAPETLCLLESSLPLRHLPLAVGTQALYVSLLDVLVQVFPLTRCVVVDFHRIHVIVDLKFRGDVVEGLWRKGIVVAY